MLFVLQLPIHRCIQPYMIRATYQMLFHAAISHIMQQHPYMSTYLLFCAATSHTFLRQPYMNRATYQMLFCAAISHTLQPQPYMTTYQMLLLCCNLLYLAKAVKHDYLPDAVSCCNILYLASAIHDYLPDTVLCCNLPYITTAAIHE